MRQQAKPEHTPGTVKLWLSPRQSWGITHLIYPRSNPSNAGTKQCHLRRDAALIEKDRLFQVDAANRLDKLFAPLAVLFPVALLGVERLF
jgi:hypothetical protein